MTETDAFAHGGWQDDPDAPVPVTPAEQRFVEGLFRLMPGYRYELSDLATERRGSDPPAP